MKDQQHPQQPIPALPADYLEWIERSWKAQGNTGDAPATYKNGAIRAYRHLSQTPSAPVMRGWIKAWERLPDEGIKRPVRRVSNNDFTWIIVKEGVINIDVGSMDMSYPGYREWLKGWEWLEETPVPEAAPSSMGEESDFNKILSERKKLLDSDILDETYAKMREIPSPGSKIKIIWQGDALDGITDEGYVFQLPFCDEQYDSLDFFVHIPNPDNSSGIGDAPQEFVHLLSLVNNPLVKEIFELPF